MGGSDHNAQRHTIDTGVIRLNSNLRNLSILCHERVSLASIVTKDGGTIEGEIQSRSKGCAWVTEEANLSSL